jgi:hypothetical protein
MQNILILGGKIVELTDEQLEIIKKASREIEFGRIIVDFTGSPSYVVDITAEKRQRFQHHRKAEPTLGKPQGGQIRGGLRGG